MPALILSGNTPNRPNGLRGMNTDLVFTKSKLLEVSLSLILTLFLRRLTINDCYHSCVRIHRSDSIQGTDYIANYFFLNLRVSRAKIQNPK